MARLIYTDFDSYAAVRNLFSGRGEPVVLEWDEGDSRRLAAGLAPGHVLVTSDESLMRACDYRAVRDDVGIALFLDRPLSCRRTLLQALGRVGRYAQACKRFARTGLELVDPNENARIRMRVADKIRRTLDDESRRKREKKAAAKKVAAVLR